LLFPYKRFVEKINEMQSAFEFREEVHGLCQCRANLENRQPMVNIQRFKQTRKQLTVLPGTNRACTGQCRPAFNFADYGTHSKSLVSQMPSLRDNFNFGC